MKFAVIGTGSMGKRRIRHIQELQSGEVIGFDIRSDRRDKVSEELNIHTVDSVEALIDENPDTIFICVPPAEHFFYLDLATKYGWNFMTEQPIWHRLEGLGEVLKKVKKNRLITHVSSNMRFHRVIKYLNRLLNNDTIGKPLAGLVELGEWLPDWHPYEPYTEYYPSKKSMGGGLDVICSLEWLCFLFGMPEQMCCIASKRSTLNIDTDDVVQILLDFKDGPQIFLHNDMIQRTFCNSFKFIGEKGTIEWNWTNSLFRVYHANTREWENIKDETPPMSKDKVMKPGWESIEQAYLEDTSTFLERLASNDTSTVSLETGIKNLELTIKAFESNEKRTTFEISNS